MSRAILHTLCATILVLLTFASTAAAQTKRPTSPAAQLPERVYSSFKKDYSGATLQSVRQNANNGQPVYELMFLDGNVHKQATYSEYGAVLALTEDIAPSSIPQNVQSAIQLQCMGCGIVKARKLTKGSNVFYEVNLTNRPRHARTFPVEVFSSDGRMVETQK
jgi:hypothetical protein